MFAITVGGCTDTTPRNMSIINYKAAQKREVRDFNFMGMGPQAYIPSFQITLFYLYLADCQDAKTLN